MDRTEPTKRCTKAAAKRQDGWAEVGDVKPQRAGTGATTDSF